MQIHSEEAGSQRKTNIVRRQVSWRNSRTDWDLPHGHDIGDGRPHPTKRRAKHDMAHHMAPGHGDRLAQFGRYSRARSVGPTGPTKIAASAPSTVVKDTRPPMLGRPRDMSGVQPRTASIFVGPAGFDDRQHSSAATICSRYVSAGPDRAVRDKNRHDRTVAGRVHCSPWSPAVDRAKPWGDPLPL